ncbi:uncharacterized protein LOC122405046 [Colletes gigas]|uniref:uncharacterized protein LOC122405046 n=1 Tax=Colletes gigas TaxID=935657 RepID=UPI001C9BAE1E|nr:uncharacterized protein LOC122405046 [Colletes gigas]
MGNSYSEKSEKKKAKQTILPRPFMSQDDFFRRWIIWKKQFIEFSKSDCGDNLLNIMGPVGLNIYATFKFDSANERKNVDVLLKKFEEYYMFSGKKWEPHENIYKYINDLQYILMGKCIENREELIKRKILTEIDKRQFTNAASTVLPTFTFPSCFKNLTLIEIAFIWTLYNSNSANSCSKCGHIHISNNYCPAQGKQCSKCNQWNHYTRRCPLLFIMNCLYCGGAHLKRQCPAFNETCTKCQKSGHFSWKCQGFQIKCRYCGLKHTRNRSLCPAQNTICNYCKSVGHFPTFCKNRSHSQKY